MCSSDLYYGDVKSRMAKAGRDPANMKILPGAFVVVGDSEQIGRASCRERV